MSLASQAPRLALASKLLAQLVEPVAVLAAHQHQTKNPAKRGRVYLFGTSGRNDDNSLGALVTCFASASLRFASKLLAQLVEPVAVLAAHQHQTKNPAKRGRVYLFGTSGRNDDNSLGALVTCFASASLRFASKLLAQLVEPVAVLAAHQHQTKNPAIGRVSLFGTSGRTRTATPEGTRF